MPSHSHFPNSSAAAGAVQGASGLAAASPANPVCVGTQPRGVRASIPPGLSPLEHCRQAAALPSPFAFSENGEGLLPSDLAAAVSSLAKLDDPAKFWSSQLETLKSEIASCANEESALNGCVHPSMTEHVAKFPSVAFERLLRKYEYDDPSAPRLLKGASLTGKMGGRESWPENLDPDTSISRDELLRIGTSEQARTWASIRPSSDDSALLAEAEADRSQGRVLGPFFDLDEIRQAVGDRFVIQRRFPVEQEDKTRPCDDYRSSHGNEATFLSRRMKLSHLDAFFALSLLVATVFPGEPLKFFKRDHEGAYRQIALLLAECVFGVFAFFHPELKRVVAYIHLVLPFGPSASVVNYNRAASAISFLCRKMFFLPCDNFFDDFWNVLPARLAPAAFDLFLEINRLLGFVIKVKKDVLPTSVGPMLGHIVDISRRPFQAENKPERRSKIECIIKSCEKKNRCSPTEAGTLAGKSAHFATALYGRCGRAALKALYKRQHGKRSDLSVQLKAALRWILRVLLSSPPREVFASVDRQVLVGYSDAAGTGRLAAVLFLPPPLRPRFTALQIPPEIGGRLLKRKTQIVPFEALGALLLLICFRRDLSNCALRHFVDSDGAAGALIRGFSSAADIACIASAFWAVAAEARAAVFIDRVDSHANVADGPSRPEKFDHLSGMRALGARWVHPPTHRFIDSVLSIFDDLAI